MSRILRAGATLFAKQGFDNTTTQQIAEAADVGTGTLFLYVSDKSELLLLLYHAAIEEALQRASAELQKKKSFSDDVQRFFGHYFSLYAKDLGLSRIFVREFLFHEGEVRKKLDEQTGRMLQMLQDRIIIEMQAGRLDKGLDPAQTALHIYALYHATLSFALAGCRQNELASTAPDLFKQLLESSMSGLLPRETAARGTARKRRASPKRHG